MIAAAMTESASKPGLVQDVVTGELSQIPAPPKIFTADEVADRLLTETIEAKYPHVLEAERQIAEIEKQLAEILMKGQKQNESNHEVC